jgi:cobalt-precorrin-5B (C1)-methyltransferase
MLERYLEKEGKKLRYGYTTGSCAAAASKAAIYALTYGEALEVVTINTPKGWVLEIPIQWTQIDGEQVTCCVIKDGGDDPDVTNGLEIHSTVSYLAESGPSGKVVISGGKGVGKVTRKGLRIAVGESAINPVPLRMIEAEVLSVDPVANVAIVISVPLGEETSLKTFNPKLGIIGGISILGTSGIVEPMSEDAFKHSLEVEMSVKVAAGTTTMVYIFGNMGRDYIRDDLGMDLPENSIQKTSNFVTYMLEAAARLGVKKLVYVGHIGKMVKVAAGMANTHSKYGDNRMESLVDCAKSFNISRALEEKILACNTTDEAVELLEVMGLKEGVLNGLALKCKEHCERITHNQVAIECLIYSTIHGELASTKHAKKILESMRDDS